MKVSLNWLKQWVSLPDNVATQEIAHRLTMAGLEVERVVPVCKGLSGLVVVEVKSKHPHPQADKLLLVQIFDGKNTTQVVCGASNVPLPGSNTQVVWAPPGATLPSGHHIASKEVRGVLSPGMLCSESEMGLSTESQGLLILSPHDGFKTGGLFADQAELPDEVLEINVTSNRPDCLGHVGIARELAALFAEEGAQLRLFQQTGKNHPTRTTTRALVQVDIQDPAVCQRYRATVIQGVQVGPTPLPLKWRLNRLGLQSVNNVVDATQLAMLEWGHPLHAFDLDKISGQKIVVQTAQSGTKWMGLDKVEYTLSDQDLVVVDASQRTLALAGILGGQESQVDAKTSNVVIESACFHALRIRRTAKKLKIQTDASYRFERGVDPNEGLQRASERCVEILTHLAGGTVCLPVVEKESKASLPHKIFLSTERVSQTLGVHLPKAKQETFLKRLGMQVKHAQSSDLLHVFVPTHRSDIRQEIDLIEEIGRLFGYDQLPATLPPASIQPSLEKLNEMSSKHNVADWARQRCVSLGFHEVQTLPLVSPQKLKKWEALDTKQRQHTPLLLDNPLREELSALRTHLLVGLLDLVPSNLAHGQRYVRLFEVAETFWPRRKGELPDEHVHVAGLIAGVRDGWLKEEQQVDVFDLKGLVEQLLKGLYEGSPHIQQSTPGESSCFHPGVAVSIWDQTAQQRLGGLGEIHPDLRRQVGIDIPVFAFELTLPDRLPDPHMFQPLPRFPSVSRDLSFFVSESTSAQEILVFLKKQAIPWLAKAEVLEDYRAPGKVPMGKKGILLGLVYRSGDRTLRDEEVQQSHQMLTDLLQQQMKIDLR